MNLAMSIIAVGLFRRCTGASTARAIIPRAITGLCLAWAVTLLGGCGGGSSTGPDSVVTVTTTPTVTARATPRSVATTAAGTAKSDVVGRKFDLGTIVRVQNDGGVPVVILDRWTARGVPDSTLAASGVPIHVHSDAPYQNFNNKITYRIPVAPGAIFTYRHCVAIDQPPVVRSSTLGEFARLPDAERVVLLTIDAKGQAVKAQNDPAC
jgi:hypothetical protein